MVGAAERNLKLLRENLDVGIWSRDHELHISGESRQVGHAAWVLEQLSHASELGKALPRQEVLDLINSAQQRKPVGRWQHSTGLPTSEALDVYSRGKPVRPMTTGQRAYVEAMLNHDLTFCVGPAGTGKTYLAVAVAVAMLKRGVVRKLVLVRPAVEAGEKLGFLPGDMQAKVNPYLRPLLDALHDMMEFDQIQRFMAVDVIEIIPLAFMRGRTLNDSVIILDEAQNTTAAQMLMFLTRLGHGSKMVITGDTTQIDLPKPGQSGLIDALRKLKYIKGAASLALDKADIVRHPLVQQIVEAYGNSQK
ncbi:MAG: PhoH family protein [Phycisphaerales bacterium]|nr:PhoH family protein [Phycisphaerales bacterium]